MSYSEQAVSVVPPDEAEKGFRTIQARAALAGFELVRMADGTYLAARWGRFRPLRDENEVETFLRIVDGRE